MAPTTSWNPETYLRYAGDRRRPFFDLTARIAAENPRTVVDLGCGPGHLTRALARRWPSARILGLDSSEAMLAAARVPTPADAGDDAPAPEFALQDASSYEPTKETDVLITNAMLQWVPDHLALIRRWLDLLPGGAWFAAQVPGNFTADSHRILREMAEEERWAPLLRGVLQHDIVHGPGEYLRTLHDAGFSADAWETTYQHVLSGADPVLEWVHGTALRPVLKALGEAEGAAFESEYAARLREAYPATTGPDGSPVTLFPFRRVFCVGHKTA
ncbi:trans-aconitate 2-methyltransferase [Zhihengliuella halotolerans]|uniref:trans-aconitate 2-methyltransferase n=1 Tax=Zhihengliuella halotolerans TaxID=370736 RepID=UPI000C808860|nr:trans-aconitate 2-methyltransferase [Zhihengliuella halotolerans]